MEIFTLGHGDGYTEQDVRAGRPGADRVAHRPAHRRDLAAAGAARRRQQDPVRRHRRLRRGRVLRRRRRAPRLPALPRRRGCGASTARTPPASSAVVDRLVAAYGPQRDLKAMFSALFTDPAFAAAEGSLPDRAGGVADRGDPRRCSVPLHRRPDGQAAGRARCRRSASCRSNRRAWAGGRPGRCGRRRRRRTCAFATASRLVGQAHAPGADRLDDVEARGAGPPARGRDAGRPAASPCSRAPSATRTSCCRSR